MAATSGLMPVAVPEAEGVGVAGVAGTDAAAVGAAGVAGAAVAGAAGAEAPEPSPASHGMGTPVLRASMSASVRSGKPERWRYACSAEITELLRALRGHFGSRPSAPPAVFVDSSDIRPYPFLLSISVFNFANLPRPGKQAQFLLSSEGPGP